MTNFDNTIKFYNENADDFYSSTLDVDMRSLYEKFLKHIEPQSLILDAGCGSGRDTLYFLKNGYNCEAFDASLDLVNKAKDLTEVDVKKSTFDQINYDMKFDAIWACASLLHVDSSKLMDSINNLTSLLKEKGFVYMSFKYGDFEGERNGRFFNDMTEEKLNPFLTHSKLSKIELWMTNDVRPGRENEKWLNIIAQKIN